MSLACNTAIIWSLIGMKNALGSAHWLREQTWQNFTRHLNNYDRDVTEVWSSTKLPRWCWCFESRQATQYTHVKTRLVTLYSRTWLFAMCVCTNTNARVKPMQCCWLILCSVSVMANLPILMEFASIWVTHLSELTLALVENVTEDVYSVWNKEKFIKLLLIRDKGNWDVSNVSLRDENVVVVVGRTRVGGRWHVLVVVVDRTRVGGGGQDTWCWWWTGHVVLVVLPTR